MFDRRVFLSAMGAAATSACVGDTVVSDAAPALTTGELQDQANLHRIYRRVRYRNDDLPVFWWKRGRRYGVVDNVMTPLFDMHVGAMYRCRELDYERYEVASVSTNFFTDLVSGELLEDWSNPLSGQVVRFTYPAPQRSVAVHSYVEGVISKADWPGMRIVGRHVLEPLEVIGEEVWLREEHWLDATVLATGRVMKVHDMYALCSPLAALREPALAFVPALEHFNDYNDWSPRFDMGDRPGTSVARCFGRKVAALDEMPDDFLRLAGQVHPETFRDPAKALG